jgi:hypothetical protein
MIRRYGYGVTGLRSQEMLIRFEFESEIPQPFYHGPKGFEHVLALLAVASEGLMEDTRRHLGSGHAS